MKNLKKSISITIVAVCSFTFAQAQEDLQPVKGTHIKDAQLNVTQTATTTSENEDESTQRKGWNGSIKGKQIQGATFGEKVNQGKANEADTNPNDQGINAKGNNRTVNSAENKEEDSDDKPKPKKYTGHVTLMK